MDADSRKKDILIFGEGPADGLGDTTITAEAKYSVKITEYRKKICLSQHYSGANSFLYANGVKTHMSTVFGKCCKRLCI